MCRHLCKTQTSKYYVIICGCPPHGSRVLSDRLQLPQLVEKLLAALDLFGEVATMSVSASPTFAPSTEQRFTEGVSKLPPGQLTEVLALLHSYLINKITRLESSVQLDSSLPLLEKAGDISRLVLSHLPASLWSSKQRDRAVQLLQSLTCDVVLPLLTACTTHVRIIYESVLTGSLLC